MKTKSPIISAVVAMAENRVIGKNNQLLWYLPADLKHFKTLTTNHPIIMGRKTFQSIGKPLINRTNIILTHNKMFQAEGCFIFSTIEKALAYVKQKNVDEVFIIGGAEIYRQSLPYLQRIHLTIVHHEFDGDTYFPVLDHTWKTIEREDYEPDEKNKYAYSFLKLERV